MLGFNRKSSTQSQPAPANPQGTADGQIPYEVYETIHEPAARRRRWTVRLIAALLLVTLLVIGGVALRNKLNDKPEFQTFPTSQDGKGNTNAASQQSPQTNSPIQRSDTDPATTPQSGSTNTGTVNQPE